MPFQVCQRNRLSDILCRQNEEAQKTYSTAVEMLDNSTLNTQVPIPNSLAFCCWISGCNLWAVCHCLSFPHRFHSYFHALLYIHPSIHPSIHPPILEIVDDVCAGTYTFLMGILRHPNTGAGSTLGKWFQYQLALCQMIGEEPRIEWYEVSD